MKRQRDLFAAGRYGIERAAYPLNGPETSRQAAAQIEAVVQDFERLALDSIAGYEVPGQRGCTCDELEQAREWPHQTASSRINRLHRKGLIRDSGKRRPTRSGRAAIVWEVVPTLEGSESR